MVLQQDTVEETFETVPFNRSVLRVTPEEVALAAAALEAKRDAEYRSRATTLPLDEAIDHLGLNATVDELAPEVEALRNERNVKARQDQAHQRSLRASRTFFAGSIAALLIFVLILSGALIESRHALRTVAHPLTALPIQKLSTVPDNVPVHIDSSALGKLAKGDIALADVSADTRVEDARSGSAFTMFNNEWTVVKSNGGLTVRGWATAEMALGISNGGKGGIFCSRPGWLPVNNLIPVEVPVYRLEGQDFARFTADGKTTDTSANGVVIAADVTDVSTAAQELIAHDLIASGKNVIPDYINISTIDVALKDGVIHLTGTADSKPLAGLAADTAEKTLGRLRLPYKIANEITISKDSE